MSIAYCLIPTGLRCLVRSLILIAHGETTVDVYFMTNPFYLPHDFRGEGGRKWFKRKKIVS